MPARPSESAPSGSVACLRTPVAKSAYGRPSRSAIVRETASICCSSVVVDDERAPRDARDELDRAVVVRRPETARDEAEIGLERLPERAARGPRPRRRRCAIRVGLEAEAHRLRGQERAVAVRALAADELAARDDDRRPRARQDVARTILLRA